MHFFLNLSIRWKLTLGFCIWMVSLILVAGTAVYAMTGLRNNQVNIQDIQLNNVIDYLAVNVSLNKNQVLLNRMMRTNTPDMRESIQQQINTISQENNVTMEKLAKRVVSDPIPEDKFLELQRARNDFIRIRDTLIIPAIIENRQDDAKSAFDSSIERYHEVNSLAEELARMAKDNVRRGVEQSIVLVKQAVLVLSVIALVTLLISVLVVFALHRAIAVPVTHVADAAVQIGDGELNLSIAGADRLDEIGSLARTFNRMTSSLRDLAEIADHISDANLTDSIKPRSKHDRLAISFSIMSENLKGLIYEMKMGTSEINATTLEILEVTKEFILEMVDQEQVRHFQNTLLRLEDVSRRLSAVVERVKLPVEK